MRICIVGHGKSLEGAEKGEEIDNYRVMRLKTGWKLCTENPTDYGTKTNYLVSSTETMGTMTLCPNPKGFIQYFAYPKYGSYEEHRVRSAQRWIKSRIVVPLDLCVKWNEVFREMGACHPNVSLGTAAIIICAGYLMVKDIILAGFDTLMNPDLEFSRIVSIPRTGRGPFPNHDWQKEHQLLGKISAKYNCDIRPI